MKNPLMRLIGVLMILAAASLACNLPGNASNLPPTAAPMSTQDIQNLENQVQSTLQSATGDVTVTLTQEQLNGIISTEIAQHPDQGISDTSVVLTQGQMEFYGKVSQSGVSANLKVVLQPEVDASGNPKLNVTSISLDGLPVPDVLKNQVATMADNALSNYVGSGSSSFKVKSITITNGQMTITGTRQ